MVTLPMISNVRNIAVSDDVFAALGRIAATHQMTVNEVVGCLVAPKLAPVTRTELVINLLLNSDFQSSLSDDKYLAVLAWLATRHTGDFTDFVQRDPSNLRYVRLRPDDAMRLRRRRISRQIGGTRYWAVMNIGAEAKRQFIARLLDFVGYDSPVVDVVCMAIGLPRAHRPRRFLWV